MVSSSEVGEGADRGQTWPCGVGSTDAAGLALAHGAAAAAQEDVRRDKGILTTNNFNALFLVDGFEVLQIYPLKRISSSRLRIF
jgi:hypothetical protein